MPMMVKRVTKKNSDDHSVTMTIEESIGMAVGTDVGPAVGGQPLEMP
jgi:hypothetical protein